MIKNRIKKLRNEFKNFDIDGYVIPKNDEFFSEYSKDDELKIISNFSGSAGYAVILKNKNFLFVDGRYTIQAEIESGKHFKIVNYQKIINCNLFKNLTLGLNPKLFTSTQVNNFFLKNNKIKLLKSSLIDKIFKKKTKLSSPFFSINNNTSGESFKSKINKITKYLKKNKSNLIFISAPENVAWLLNIRGHDNPNSPIPNCYLILNDRKKIYLIAERKKVQKLLKEKKINSKQTIEPKKFSSLIKNLKGKNIIIDQKTCSIFYESLIKKKFKILQKDDPIYMLKAIKNKIEIKNMINAHIIDGVALTKFLYWIKILNKKKISEFDAQIKLEKFRKNNRNYLYPSFNTISATGSMSYCPL